MYRNAFILAFLLGACSPPPSQNTLGGPTGATQTDSSITVTGTDGMRVVLTGEGRKAFEDRILSSAVPLDSFWFEVIQRRPTFQFPEPPGGAEWLGTRHRTLIDSVEAAAAQQPDVVYIGAFSYPETKEQYVRYVMTEQNYDDGFVTFCNYWEAVLVTDLSGSSLAPEDSLYPQ